MPLFKSKEEGERNKGDSLRILGKNEEAIMHYDRAIQSNPRYQAAWEFKIVCLRHLGRLEEALKCCNEAISVIPNSWCLFHYKGLCLHDLGRFVEAIECYDKALQIEPVNCFVWQSKGVSLNSLGRFEEAIKYYDKAIEKWPHVHFSLNSKGVSLGNLGQFKEAIECFDKALQLYSKDETVYYNKAVVLRALGQYKEAIECYNEALKLKPQYKDALTGRMQTTCTLESRMVSFESIMNPVLLWDEANSMFYGTYENCPAKLWNDNLSAAAWFNSQNFVAPPTFAGEEGAAEYFFNLSAEAQKSGNFQEAWAGYHQALKRFFVMNNEKMLALTCFNLGKVYGTRKDWEIAQLLFLESTYLSNKIQDKKGYAWSLFYLGDTCEKLNNPALARRFISEALPLFKEVIPEDVEGVEEALVRLSSN